MPVAPVLVTGETVRLVFNPRRPFVRCRPCIGRHHQTRENMFPFWIDYSVTSLLDWLPLAVGGLTMWLTSGMAIGQRA